MEKQSSKVPMFTLCEPYVPRRLPNDLIISVSGRDKNKSLTILTSAG